MDSPSIASPAPPFPFLSNSAASGLLCSFLWVLLSLLFHIQTIFCSTRIGCNWKWRREEVSFLSLFRGGSERGRLMRDQGFLLDGDCNCFSNIHIWISLQCCLHGDALPHVSGKMTVVIPVEIMAVLKHLQGHEGWVLRRIH